MAGRRLAVWIVVLAVALVSGAVSVDAVHRPWRSAAVEAPRRFGRVVGDLLVAPGAGARARNSRSRPDAVCRRSNPPLAILARA